MTATSVLQPDLPAHAAGVLSAAIARWRNEPGALLPLLHDVQDGVGHIPPVFVDEIARAVNLSRAEVHGVITYYPHFHRAPTGRHVLQLCQAEACRAMGASPLMAHAEQRLGCAAHRNTADGLFTLEPVYCLGLCASAPAMMIDEKPHARLTPERFDRLVEALSHGPVEASNDPPLGAFA